MNESQSPSAGSRFRAYLELLRLPNVFTALADVTMGYLVTHGSLAPAPHFAMLAGASAALYLSGMALNDAFDARVDAEQRPERPIPSGRVPLAAARLLGIELLLLGAALGWVASYFAGQWKSGIVATGIAALVLLYNGGLKRTPLGPLAMGGCRFLNVLFGMSLSATPLDAAHWLIASGIGVYIVGVTWFARTEARESSRPQLALATLVLVGGLALLAVYPRFAPWAFDPVRLQPERWYGFWIVMSLLIGWRCAQAVVQPTPRLVQAAVRQCLFSIVVLDAAVTFAAAGFGWAVIVLALLAPMMLVGRWIYST